MHPDWQQFLVNENANINDNLIGPFSAPKVEAELAMSGSIMADCSDLGILRFSGDDARDFLHNQLSNDVNALLGNESRLAAYCNPKGRALAIVRIFNRDDSIFMLLPRDIIDAVHKRLQMFVLMSKVSIENVSDDFVIMGVAGDKAGESLNKLAGGLPSKAADVHDVEGTSIIKLPQHDSRYLLVGTVDDIAKLWQQLKSAATAVGQDAWQLLDIHSGQPQVHADTAEAFVPQMLNMHAIDGISFKKGCYPGQEIVARMYYLGKLKRRMYLAHVNTATCPPPGTPLFASESSSGQGAGQVVTASTAAAGGFDLLMVCPVNIVETASIRLSDEHGPELELHPLPYEVPLERESS